MKLHHKNTIHYIAASFALSLSMISPLHAVTVIASTADAHVRLAGAGDGGSVNITSTGATNFLGRGSSTDSSVYVMPFLLPTLLTGQSFANATFSFTSNGTDNGASFGANVDLYGLGNRASATVGGGDYYVGANTTSYDSTDATLIKENMIVSGTAAPSGTVFTTTVADLTTYLNANSTTVAGTRYVFLRVGTDIAYTSNRINVHSATAAASSDRPTLTFDVIPEPSAGLIGGLEAVLKLSSRIFWRASACSSTGRPWLRSVRFLLRNPESTAVTG